MPFKPGEVPEGAILFQPGWKGGPGAPRGKRWSTYRREFLEGKITAEDLQGQVKEMTVEQAIILKQIKLAMAGDGRQIENLNDREEGKPVQPIELKGEMINAIASLAPDELDGYIDKLSKLTSDEGGG